MKTVTSTDAYTIFQRRDGRYAVKAADKSAINGDDKVKILLEQGLITAPPPKAEPEPEPEAPAEDTAEAAEAASEDTAEAAGDDAAEEKSE